VGPLIAAFPKPQRLNQTTFSFLAAHKLQQLFHIPQFIVTFSKVTAQPNKSQVFLKEQKGLKQLTPPKTTTQPNIP
jgi:hypothetical protein